MVRLFICGLSSFNPLLASFCFSKTSSLPVQSTLPMPRSAEHRSSRAAKEREHRAVDSPASRQAGLASDKAATRDRRAAETPPSRQVRLASDKASTQRRRQAQTLESSITAKRRNSRMRAELRRQAADVAAASSGSLGVMNARRLSHLKNAGASAALEIARQDVLADIQQHISLSTLDMAQCVSDFSAVNNVDMRVCASCGTRDPDDPYSREVTAAHMVNTMNFRVYELGSMNFRVLAHSPRPPPGKQLNVPQPGFSP